MGKMSPEELQALRDLTAEFKSSQEPWTDEEYQNLVRLTRAAGFSPRSLTELPTPKGFDALDVANQMVSGFVSGFTAFPNYADEPETEVEALANSLGHLGGFIGMVFPPLGAGKAGITVGGLAARGIAKAGQVSYGAQKFSRTIGALTQAGEVASPIVRFRSVPMQVADVAMKGLGRTAPAQAAQKFLMQSSGGRLGLQMAEQGLHLGIASSVSSLHQGIDDAILSGAWGTAFGGVFGAVSNIRLGLSPGQFQSTPNTIIKMAAGSLTQGSISTINDEPAYAQAYNYLMGALFSAGPNRDKYQALKVLGEPEFTQNNMSGKPELVKAHAKYQALPDAVKEQVDILLEQMHRPMSVQAVINGLIKSVGEGKSLDMDKVQNARPEELMYVLNKPLDANVVPGSKVIIYPYKDPKTGDTKSPELEVIDVVDNRRGVWVRLPNGKKERYPWYTVVDSKKADDMATKMWLDDPLRFGEDFDPVDRDATLGSLQSLMERSLPEGYTPERAAAYVREFNETLRKTIETGPGAFSAFKSYVESKLVSEDKTLTPSELRSMMRVYYYTKHGETQKIGYYNDTTGALTIYEPIPGSSVIYDIENNRMDLRIAPRWAKDMLVINRTVMDTGAERITKGKRFTTDSKGMNVLRTIVAQVRANGYHFFVGNADKGQLHFVKRHPLGEATPESELTRIMTAYEKAGLKNAEDWYDAMFERDTRLGLVPNMDVFRDEFISLHRHEEERVFGHVSDKPTNLARMLKGGADYDFAEKKIIPPAKRVKRKAGEFVPTGDAYVDRLRESVRNAKKLKPGFILDAPGKNKREQIVSTTGYPLDRDLLSPDDLADERNWRYVVVRDADESWSGAPKELEDGAMTTSDRAMNLILSGMGHQTTDAFAKLFLVSGDEKLGALLGKPMVNRASARLSAAMEKAGVSHIVPLSVAKQWGLRDVVFAAFHPEKDELVLMDEAGKVLKPEEAPVYKFQPEDFRLILDMSDFKISQRGTRMTKGTFTTANELQLGREAMNAMDDFIVDRAMKGTPEQSALAAKYIETKDTAILDQIDWEQLPWDDAVRLIKDDRAYESLQRSMDKMQDEDPADLDLENVPFAHTRSQYSAVDRIIHLAGDANVLLSKHVRGIANARLKDYFVKRLTNMYVNGAKAYIAGWNLEDQATRRVGDDQIWLYEDYRKMPIDGIGTDGKEMRTTLGEQFDLYQNVVKGTITGASQELAAAMRDRLELVIGREPTDDASGRVALTLAGFLDGRKGSGVLIGKKVYHLLSGADNDADSISIYANLPKAYRKALKNMKRNRLADGKWSERVSRQFYLTEDDLMPETKEFGWMRTPYGMMDWYHRLHLAQSVPEGRLDVMGMMVAMKHTLGTLYEAAYSQPGRTYTSHSAYGEGRARFTARVVPGDETPGDTFRGYMSLATNVAVDVAKVGVGMRSPDELITHGLIAGFDEITLEHDTKRLVLNLRPLLREDGTIDVHSDTYHDVLDWVSGAMEKPPVRYTDTDIMVHRRILKRIHGWDFQSRRPFTLQEVAYESQKWPEQFKGPYSLFTKVLSKIDWNDSFLSRVFESWEQWPPGLKRAATFLHELPDNVVGRLLGDRKPQKFVTSFNAPFMRLNLLKGWYHPYSPDKYLNLAYEKGKDQLAKDTDAFNAFFGQHYNMRLEEMKPELEKRMRGAKKASEETGLKLDTSSIAYTATDHYAEWLKNLRIKKPELLDSYEENGYIPRWVRERIVREFVQQTEDYTYSRLKDIVSWRDIQYFYQRSGLPEMRAREYLKEIAGLRQRERYYRRKRLDWKFDETEKEWRPATDEEKRTAEQNYQIYGSIEGKRRILEVLEQKIRVDAKRMPDKIDEEAAVDFLHAAFLANHEFGTEKTFDQYRLVEIIRPQVTRRFYKSYSDLVNRVRDSFTEEDVKAYFMDMENNAAVLSTKMQGEDQRLFMNYFLVGQGDPGKVDPEVYTLAREISEILTTYKAENGEPFFAGKPEKFLEMTRELLNVAQPKDLTLPDLQKLRNILVGWKTGPGLIRWALWGGTDKWKTLQEVYVKRGGQMPSWWTYMGFIPTLSEHLRFNDFRLIDRAVYGDKGEITPQAGVFPVIDEGRLEYVYANAAVPVSTLFRVMQYVQKIGLLSGQADIVDSDIMREFRKTYGEVVGADGKDMTQDFFELAWRQREFLGADIALQRMHPAIDSPEEYAKLRSNRDEFKKRYDVVYERMKDQLEQSFTLPSPEGGRKLRGTEVAAMMRDRMEGIMKDYFYNKKVRFTGDQAKAFFVVDGPFKVNINATLKKLTDVLVNAKLDKDNQVSYDQASLLNYFFDIEEGVGKPPAVKKPTREEINAGHFGPPAELRLALEGYPVKLPENLDVIVNVARYYLAGMRYSDGPAAFRQNLEFRLAARRRPMPPGAELGLRIASLHYERTDGVWPITDKLQKPLAQAMTRVASYPRRRVRKNEVMSLVFGHRTYSQLANDIAYADGQIKYEEYMRRLLMNQTPWRATGYLEGYMPHGGATRGELLKLMRAEVEEAMKDSHDVLTTTDRLNIIHDKYRSLEQDEFLPDGGLLGEDGDILKPSRIDREMDLPPRYAGNMLRRKANLPAYEVSPEAIATYYSKLNKAIYGRLFLMLARGAIREFEVRKGAGDFTSQWADIIRLYVRQNLGYPSLFPQRLLDDPAMKLNKSPYHWTSDHAWYSPATKAYKLWKKLSGTEFLTPVELAKMELNLGRKPTKADIQQELDRRLKTMQTDTPDEEMLYRMANLMRNASNLEARFAMMSLLAHAKTGIANLYGANVNTIIYSGLTPWMKTFDFDTWQKINPEWKSMNEVRDWPVRLNVVEEWITNEAQMMKTKPANWDAFMKDYTAKLKKDPEMSDEGLFSLGKKHGINEAVFRGAAYFMQKTERMARTKAFLAAYLQIRQSMYPMPLKYDNPFLIEYAKRAVAVTQFLYGNDVRPLFAGTNVGKIYSRFKLWAWSSVTFQRKVFEEARNMGYQPHSMEFQRLQRLMTANLFAISLATLLPFTMFDSGLPAPLSYFQNLADWLFGSDRQRERVFFTESTGIPTWLAPMNELMPSIARFPKGLYDVPGSIGTIVSGDLDRLGEYTSYSIFPFGRLAKDGLRAMDNPGYAFDVLTGIPLKRIGQAKRKNRWRSPHPFFSPDNNEE